MHERSGLHLFDERRDPLYYTRASTVSAAHESKLVQHNKLIALASAQDWKRAR